MKRFGKRIVAFLAIWILTGGVAYGLDDLDFGYGEPNDRVTGTGIVSFSIDDDPRPDYLSCHSHSHESMDTSTGYHDSPKDSRIECAIAKNVDKSNNASWTHTEHYDFGVKFQYIEGVGVAIGDIDKNGDKDLVLVGIQGHYLRYRIAKDIKENGHTDDEREFFVDKYIGAETRGLGASLFDLDHNGKLDLLVVWISGERTVEFSILWDLDKDGQYDRTTQETLQRNLRDEEGLGVEIHQLDDNPAPDLYYAYVSNNKEYYESKILYNINSEGNYQSFSNAESRKLSEKKRRANGNLSMNIGMGVALSEVDGHFIYDATLSYPLDDSRKIRLDTQMDSVKKNDEIEKIKTKESIEFVKHLGKVVSVIKNMDGKLEYSVMQDNEEWTTPQELENSNSEDDASVTKQNSNKVPIEYRYKTIPEYKSFHLISDGEYLYLFYTNNEGKLFSTRYILQKSTNKLVIPYDVRYRETSEKCNYSEKIGYKDMNGKLFYEPSVEISYLFQNGIKVDDFSVHIIPTSITDEERWQILALDTNGAMHELSFRRAKEDFCDSNNSRVYFKGYPLDEDKIITFDNDGIEDKINLKGVIYNKFKESDKTFNGLSSTLYSNQQECNETIIKREQRIKLILSEEENMIEVDYAINNYGTLLPIDTSKDNYENKTCSENSSKAYSYTNILEYGSKLTPFIYESSDGFLHLIFSDTGDNQFNEMIYDTLNNKWVRSDDSKEILDRISGGVGKWNDTYRRSPWFYYEVYDSGKPARAIEYGSYSYEGVDIKGEIKRISSYYNRDDYAYINRDKVGKLEASWLTTNIIDATIIGYIEGAPPIPQENFTYEEDYTDATSIEMIDAKSIERTYAQSKDRGLDFETGGHVGITAFNIETSNSCLSENSVGTEATTTKKIKQRLEGEWNSDKKEWEPKNVGMALVKGKRVDMYGLYLNKGQENNRRLYAYRVVPQSGDTNIDLIPFKINPKYSKNGDLGSYKNDIELKQIKKRIKKREQHLQAYYNQYKTTAFNTVPKLNNISKRNIINAYTWNRDGGRMSTESSFATSISESFGGSFSFQGMMGGYISDPFYDLVNLTVLSGTHVNKTFSKTTEEKDNFELSTETNLESRGIEPYSGKVNHFNWKTVYLEPSSDNFNDFFNEVVDLDWLKNSERDEAKTLREARNRLNKAWRIRHFVTFISRMYEQNPNKDSNQTTKK